MASGERVEAVTGNVVIFRGYFAPYFEPQKGWPLLDEFLQIYIQQEPYTLSKATKKPYFIPPANTTFDTNISPPVCTFT